MGTTPNNTSTTSSPFAEDVKYQNFIIPFANNNNNNNNYNNDNQSIVFKIFLLD